MFERYTEKARRVIFFARYEASQYGGDCIETEHLLLGLLRESKANAMELMPNVSLQAIEDEIAKRTSGKEKVSTSVDLPLSNESKRVLTNAAEEAERLADRYIGTEHLLLGLLREKSSFGAALLKKHGVVLEKARAYIAQLPQESRSDSKPSASLVIGSGGGGHTVEFEDAQSGEQIGITLGLNIPNVGHDVLINGTKFVVVAVEHRYRRDPTGNVNIPEKIVVRLRREEGTTPP